MKEPTVTVSLTGCEKNGHIPGGTIWVMDWLPKGYGPTKDDVRLCVFFDPTGKWSEHGLGSERPLPPLLQAVKDAINKHLREHPEDISGHLLSKDW